MEKLLLIQKIKLPEHESVRLLIDSIPHLSIKTAAIAFRIKEIDLFLREMKNLTSACSSSLKKFPPTTKPEKVSPESKKNDVVRSPISTIQPTDSFGSLLCILQEQGPHQGLLPKIKEEGTGSWNSPNFTS